MTTIGMYYTGEICPECNNKIYTDGYVIWCDRDCRLHGMKVEYGKVAR